jgi:hypothetical protein
MFSSQWSGQISEGGGGADLFLYPKTNVTVRISEIQTCLARRLDISEKHYWNLVLAPDMSGAWT